MTYIGDTSPLFAGNESYVADLYAQYLKSPTAISDEWKTLFDAMGSDADSLFGGDGTPESEQSRFATERGGPQWQDRTSAVVGEQETSISDAMLGGGVPYAQIAESIKQQTQSGGASPQQIMTAARQSVSAIMLIRAYRAMGHHAANLDPLHLTNPEDIPELNYTTYGFNADELDTEIYLHGVLGLERATLTQVLETCQDTYCRNIGVEYAHMVCPEERSWLQRRIETDRNTPQFTEKGKTAILQSLVEGVTFEQFLDKKYRGTKRFGMDGLESTIPVVEQIVKKGSQMGLEETVIGMAHRGRLNMLSNVLKKPYRAIFHEFRGGNSNPDDINASSDVKYHLGASSSRTFDGREVAMSLSPNPSHLECINTVVLGRVRAKQRLRNAQHERHKVLPILMHGDAAFIGQGIVAETFLLSELRGYRTGGTIHIATNNQIGFTTNPSDSRSSPYCTDMAKVIGAPILHANGDDPEACVHIARIASEYRQTFGKDVVLDIIGYRRHGHNEGEEPMFTQPLMYKRIKGHPPVDEIYAEKLQADGTITADQFQGMKSQFSDHLEDEFAISETFKPNEANWLKGEWKDIVPQHRSKDVVGKTGVKKDLLQKIGKTITTVPEGFNINSKVARQLKAKDTAITSGKGIDWATAEALAFGVLLEEGHHVRLSGEDCERGTFSQRHSVWIDQETEQKYIPLEHISEEQEKFQVINSPLSEFGLLGYEYGFAATIPSALVMWEAQFGDFANGAQVIIDQFLASGETKWLRKNGLVMLLPHGYEGQGPEHSSARLERFLQLSAENNWQVVNITTPANYFHALCRQVKRDFRKPLVQMSPKYLLRHKACVSDLADFTTGSHFEPVLADPAHDSGDIAPAGKIKRVVLCSGKVYYDLDDHRRAENIKDVALVRVEQLYPFPEKELAETLAPYKKAEIIWCQEEPQNNGSWFFVDRLIEQVLVDNDMACKRPRYVGRPASASPATGLAVRHAQEQKALITESFASPYDVDSGLVKKSKKK